ncbi:hypothetical protein AB0M44_29555 [Streptosporangium subroseum]|uniref:hypothetical protein n=1 Tax=Streptosporangium subroseum TaxID=106412 RepID=UPI00342F6886
MVDDWGREFRCAARIRIWSDAELIGARAIIGVRNVERRGGEVRIRPHAGATGSGPRR